MEPLRISELAARAQVPVSTLRYYERIGLLPRPERLDNGYRVYDESVVEQLVFIGRVKRMGVPLTDIAELIELWSTEGCRPLQDRIRSFLAGRIAEVGAQRVDLTTFEGQLRSLARRLDGSEAVGGPDGRCELDCRCVRLDSQDPATAAGAAGACALNGAAMSQRLNQWAELLQQATAIERLGHGRRVAFPLSGDIAARLGGLCAAEVGCCTFFSFAMTIDANAIVLEVGGTDTSESMQLMDLIFPGSAAFAGR